MNGRESREKNCCWHFDKATGSNQGPNDSSEMHFTGGLYHTLVRESIQNSLDAVLDTSKPVMVKIEMGELEKRFFPNFFELIRHIKSCIDTYEEQAIRFVPMLEYFMGVDKNEKIGYLKVTDSNTKGMRYEEGNIKCPFSAFAFSSGVNSKENNDTSGGAYGFGKTAFFQLSKIRTIMVSSIYDDNNKSAFTGISRLCTHKLNGETKTDVGYYSNIVQTKDGEKSIPVTQLEEIPKKFRLEERGTSVSVIGVDVSDNGKQKATSEMVKAVLCNYWLAIWEEKLVVDICENTISKSNINKWMDTTFPDDYTKNAIHSNTYNPRPYFDAVKFAGQKDDCWRFQEDLLPDIGKVDLYIKKTSVGNDYVVYMRSNLMFIFSKKRPTHYGFNALFVCRGSRGNRILKELENPNHNEWKENNRIQKLNLDSDSINGKLGKQVLEKIENFITKSTEGLFHSGDNEILTIAGLEDYLYIPETLLADVSPKRNEDAISGNPAEGKQKDGSAPKAIIEGEAKIDEKEKREVGHVIITKSGKLLPNDKSNNVVGAGYEHKGGGPKPKSTRASGNFTQADVIPDDSSSFSKLIPIEYRVVALSQDDLVYHDIIFKSPVEAEHGAIEILVGGEQKEEIPQILQTKAGTIQGNRITDLHIKEGKNVVRIQLGDKLKHAIKLAAYENK